MNEQVHVVAIFQAKADRLKDLIDVFDSLAVESRAEAGCIEYGFIQNSKDSSVIFSVEKWRDGPAFDAHLASPHCKSAFDLLPALLQREPQIYTCTTVV